MQVCSNIARGNPHTSEILRHGWSPVLAAMVISSMGGKILNAVIARSSINEIFSHME